MSRWSSLLGVAFGAVVTLAAGAARADFLPACGGAVLTAGQVSCNVETMGGCTADCTAVNFQVACTGQLEAGCTGSCSGMASASCTAGSCQASCMGSCTGQPGTFTCEGSCETDCRGNCMR